MSKYRAVVRTAKAERQTALIPNVESDPSLYTIYAPKCRAMTHYAGGGIQ